MPNRELLALWARNYLETCTTETCGIGDRDNTVNSARIDLHQANLSEARLAEKQLKELRTYEGAKLPDNLKHLEH